MRIGRLVVAGFVAAALLVASGADARGVPSNRQDKCLLRADWYAAQPHEGLTAQERQSRIDWLYAQCAQNAAADGAAEEQGALAPELFPNRGADRHAHPLHCLDLADERFGMHTNEDKPNPPPDPLAPGGAAGLNVPGEFMYAWIDGKPRFFMREVVWAIDDRDGEVISPIRLNVEPGGTFQQVTVAEVDFATAYEPVSIWIELPEGLATATRMHNLPLSGRRLATRTWIRPSGCHDKRAPMVVPEVLVDHMKGLGWAKLWRRPHAPHVLRFQADGDPELGSSWSLQQIPTESPVQVFQRGDYRWFYDTDLPGPGDGTPPHAGVNHGIGAKKTAPDVTIRGSASDNDGVAVVQVAIKDRDSGLWLRRNGTFGPNQIFHTAVLVNPDETATDWRLRVQLPAGRYNPVVRSFDEAGNRGDMDVWRPFRVVVPDS